MILHDMKLASKVAMNVVDQISRTCDDVYLLW
jgi:hypothetical protein